MDITKKTKAKADLLSSQRIILWVANLTTASVTALIYAFEGQVLIASVWCFAHYVLAAIRYTDIQAYQRGEYNSEEEIQKWFKKFAVFTSIAGGLWGLCAYFIFVINQPSVLVFSVIMMLSMATGALLALTAHFPAYLSFVLPIFSALCLSLYFSDFRYSNILALLVFPYAGAIIFFGKNLSNQSILSITSALQVQELLAQTSAAKESIERATHEKNRLLALIGHDLNQPVFTISLLAQSLQNSLDESTRKLQVQRLQTSVEGLQALSSAFMEFAAIEDGLTPTNLNDFKIRNILYNIESDFRPLAEKKGLKFYVDECDEIVKSDSLLLGRILRNVVGNAIKYTHQGEVKIILDSDDVNLKIHVIDTGIGIAKEHLNDIFCEYTQLNNAKQDPKGGLGLGLTVVKQLCQILAHSYDITSSLGIGTDFSIHIPLSITASNITNIVDDKLKFKDIHIMIIENDENVSLALSTLLQKWGGQTSCGKNIDIALASSKYIIRPVDIILCDYDLGDSNNGLQCIERLRLLIDSQLPAILISGCYDKMIQRQIESLGIAFLRKPVEPALLKKRIFQLL